MNRKGRVILIALAALTFISLAGFVVWSIAAENSRMTPQKLALYVQSVDLKKLSGADRAKALGRLAEGENALSPDERRRWRIEGIWRGWFKEMTEDERGRYLEATLPTGFKQVINEFEDLPQAKRKQTFDAVMTSLREKHRLPIDREPGREEPAFGTNGPPQLSADLEKKVLALGLKTYYSESSAQTKAEMAPVLEELQHQMQSGRSLQ